MECEDRVLLYVMPFDAGGVGCGRHERALQLFALVFDREIARFDVNVMLMLMLNVNMDILSHLLQSVNHFIK